MKLKDLLKEGPYDQGIFKAAFLTGGPASGKSFVASELFGINQLNMGRTSMYGLKVVNPDAFLELMMKQKGLDIGKIHEMPPEAVNKIHGKAAIKNTMYFNQLKQSRIGMIIDGTGANIERVISQKRTLERIGYDTMLIFVDTPLEVALANNAKRSRRLADDVVKGIWETTQIRKKELISMFPNHRIILNDGKSPISNEAKKFVEKFVQAPIKNPVALRWIKFLTTNQNKPKIHEAIDVTDVKIYCDMDSVLTDFNKQFEILFNADSHETEAKYGKSYHWNLIGKAGEEFWSKMPWMPDGKQLWSFIKKYPTEILSAPSKDNTSRIGKKKWVATNLGGAVKVNLAFKVDKQKFAGPNNILIDDMPNNIAQWKAAGGIGILHKSAGSTISQLKKILES